MNDDCEDSWKADIRKKAEKRLQKQIRAIAPLAEKDRQYLISELGTYQIELEMQNEDLKRTQQALEQSRDMFRDLHDFAPVGYLTINERSGIHSVNLTGCEMLGRAPNDLVGWPLAGFVHDGDKNKFRDHVTKVFKQDIRGVCELRLIRSDNSFFHAELRSRIVIQKGKKTLCQVALIDISDRKRAEEFKKWADIFNSTRIGLYIRRGDEQTHEMINPAYAEMHGYTIEELIGKPIKDLYTPEEQKKLPGYFRASEEKGLYVHESMHVRKDGTIFPVEITVNVVRDDKGEILYRIANAQDITDRKKAEAELQESEKRFRAFFESAGVGTAILDMSTRRFLDVNDKLCRITGYNCDELRSLTFEDITHPDHRAYDALQYERLMTGEVSEYLAEKRYIRKDGTVVWVQVAATIVRNMLGRPAVALGIIQDISGRKSAEQKIAVLNQNLLEKVKELETVRKDLQEAYTEMEKFSYSVSHDLRAPVRQMKDFAELLRARLKDYPDETAVKYTKSISSAGKRMICLIDDILGFSRLSFQEMPLGKVKLDALLSAVVLDLSKETEARSIEWKIDPLPVVNGNRTMLRLALVNLISNALKFTAPRPSAVIEVRCAEKEDAFVICIKDNGVGFDMKYAGRLFGVFQRLHSQSEFEGTGIGLANVQRIISRHGGRTWAEGAEDKGATFCFTLPKKLKS